MRPYRIALAMGIIALALVLSHSTPAFAQLAPFVQSAVVVATSESDSGSGLRATVPVVPVKRRHYRGWNSDWEHWSDPHDWYHHRYEGRHAPEYRHRHRGWGYGSGSYTCWSDGWRTYCGVY